MRNFLFTILLLWISMSGVQAEPLLEYLKRFPQVEEAEAMTPNHFFTEAVRLKLRQPVDPARPDAGTFLQRVFISVKQPEAPVVLVTEGYAASYGANQGYLNELSPILSASQVVVEHRYFGQSWPDQADWQYLTVENAAADHHRVVTLLKPYLTGTWINTGISKGGQTALLHRVFHPNDVAVTVSYVAPFNFGVEDGRHEPYISKVPGTKSQRKKVEQFQKEVLKRRASLMPMFRKLVEENNYTFNAGMDEIFDFCVLEYSFAFWQWGTNPDQIPPSNASNEEIFAHFSKISSPDYFSLEALKRIGSFFVQAAKELGYYGYDIRPFRKQLTISNAGRYLERLFLPDGFSAEFDDASVLKTKAFLEITDAPMIFIYGANDPWTASGVIPPARENFLRIVQPGASHNIRISGLEESNRELVTGKLKEWVGIRETVSAD